LWCGWRCSSRGNHSYTLTCKSLVVVQVLDFVHWDIKEWGKWCGSTLSSQGAISTHDWNELILKIPCWKKIPLLRLYFPSQKLCSLNFYFYFFNFNIFTNNIISDEDAKVMQYTTWLFVFQMVLHFQKYSNHFDLSLQYFKLQICVQMNHEREKIQASFYIACYLMQNDINILQFSWISF
jgi:hypothetical protein